MQNCSEKRTKSGIVIKVMLEKRELLKTPQQQCGISLLLLDMLRMRKNGVRNGGSEETKMTTMTTLKSPRRDVCCAMTNYRYTR